MTSWLVDNTSLKPRFHRAEHRYSKFQVNSICTQEKEGAIIQPDPTTR